MTTLRKPAAFKLPQSAKGRTQKEIASPRQPRAAAQIEVIAGDDVFNQDIVPVTPTPPTPIKNKWTAWKVFLSAAGLLVSLAFGLWIDKLIRDLFSRADWLGYGASGIVLLGVFALLFGLFKEFRGLSHLKSTTLLRDEAAKAFAADDATKARAVLEKLDLQLSLVPQTARGRQMLKDAHNEIIDGSDLIRLAEHTLLKPLDDIARTMILDSAKRVSVVTAVSPRALVDLAYVIYECARLIRRLAELYGSRPSTLGLLSLSRNVIAHLAITGSIAAGDALIQQLVGHGLAAKISARLGEGIINGLMTARVGIAAVSLVRPLEFNAEKRPGISDFLSDLSNLTKDKSGTA